MHIDQQPYRDLYDRIMDYEGDALYGDLLRPWLDTQDGERRWLAQLRARTGTPIPPVQPEELWRLYALSRIVDLLHLSFAPPVDDPRWDVATVSRDEHAAFMEALGLERVDHPAFHPFYHEIVTVDQAEDDDEAPSIAEVHWPAYMLGPLLITRAGCRVRAGRRHLVKEIAEGSTLYWAYARKHRPAADPSHGWGSNSQWRTSFRRDYALGRRLWYNADAKPREGPEMDEDLEPGERAELLRHRCFVTCAKRDDDRWPYGLSLAEGA
ncbi:MAG TPA: hypothetical protein VFS20_09070 [Longimicrobium sp.]|nr:hypothetical protein [Longimicrobium sp.]